MNDIPVSLKSIVSHSSDPAGAWIGTKPNIAKQYYDEVYGAGIALTASYGIELIPMFRNSLLATSKIKMYDSYELNTYLKTKSKQGNQSSYPELIEQNIPIVSSFNHILPFLCQSISTGHITAQVDTIQIGSQPFNFFTGSTTPEITLNLIETRNYAISNSLTAIKSIMFPKDGTQALPKDYLMRLRIYAYDRHIRAIEPFELNYIVAIESSSLNFDATTVNTGMIIPITLTPMFPNMVDDNRNDVM